MKSRTYEIQLECPGSCWLVQTRQFSMRWAKEWIRKYGRKSATYRVVKIERSVSFTRKAAKQKPRRR
jgi:hypothetical protein